MDIELALDRLGSLHRAVMLTWRRDGSPQLSPVTCALGEDHRVVVSTRETAMKARNLRRDPRVALLAMSDRFFGPWVQLEGRADIQSLPEAMDGLVAYYRAVSGEHPDWEEYRQAMIDERRVLVRITVERAGPDVSG
jgi:PPOX class probable F420-dependent enzyme